MIMTEQQKNKAIKEYRKIKRKELKSRIVELENNNKEFFRLWVFKKAQDEEYLRKAAWQNCVEIDKLKNMYEKAQTEPVSEAEISRMKVF